MIENKKLVRMAIDLANGKVQKYSHDEGQEIVRGALRELSAFTSGERGAYTIDQKVFRRNKIELFEILEEIVDEYLEEGLKNQFDGFAEYRNLAWGDTNLFRVPAEQMFRVALISDGNGNLRRQRLRDGEEFQVHLDTYGIKIGEDYHRFLAKRVDWADLMKEIAISFQRYMTQRVYQAVMDSYQTYNSTYHFSGTLTEDDLIELAMHIEARTGSKVTIYGTKLALRRIAPDSLTDSMIEERNRLGYIGLVAGIPMREIEQSHEYGTDDFAIDNDMILVLPEGHDKMVKVVNEGQSIFQDQAGGQSADMMQEYFIANRFGVSVITSKVFGFVKLV